jgi:hypothetical protein
MYLIIYKITNTEMGSPCNENGEYKNYQKNNRMDAIQNNTSRETQVKVDGPGTRPKEDENYWLDGEGRGQTGMEQTKTHPGL